MINGPRRSRIGWNPTEIEASKVGKPRKTPGFPGHRFPLDAAAADRYQALAERGPTRGLRGLGRAAHRLRRQLVASTNRIADATRRLDRKLAPLVDL